ncbi:MBL fold metallo-hydrolase [Oceaniglobus ichthyenteri]|uniref:MBL fold metallo-hydrolase n=1 Tax=Oceaniglobus ichthyenteri TaxID=2136177 RepID=UPI00197CDF53|nr:3',5'-cyclic-nucleotide phosphodiesterase [Oceaniglobus ichthyenteri]
MRRLFALSLAACLLPLSALAQGFDVTVLGATGGIQDGNLSAFMIAPHGDARAVTCDAGALVAGLIAAEAAGNLGAITVPEGSDYTRVGHTLTDVIRGYMISHAHMDHIAGLIVASPDDSAKPIYAIQSVHDDFADSIFNWVAWPNFGTTGAEPRLGKYAATVLTPGAPVPIADTEMTVTAYPLAHSGRDSTAFLVQSGDDALLCLGDTGPDRVNNSGNLAALWQATAPLAASGALKGIIIESSYTSERPDTLLFGHLTPRLIMDELAVLAKHAGGTDSLKDLPIIISHVKYSLRTGPSPRDIITDELNKMNTLGLKIIMPVQGDLYRLGG